MPEFKDSFDKINIPEILEEESKFSEKKKEENLFDNIGSVRDNFGINLKYIKDREERIKSLRRIKNPSIEEIDEGILGKKVLVSEFYKESREVALIPNNFFLNVVDEWDESVQPGIINFPFSSFDFYIDFLEKKEGSVFQAFYHSEAFSRLVKIQQLGCLISPLSESESEKEAPKSSSSNLYLYPWFRHTRWEHSILTAALMDITLARNDFTEEERATPVLTAACHDIAIPAGGDATKRIDLENLDEEKNFSWVMKESGLSEKWKKQFNFDISIASELVQNKHLFGKLLDVFDKISYTALDCYHIGRLNQQKESKIVSLCIENPLIMDVWQDIQFTADKTNFGFSNPDRLFQFLLLRAYEHKEIIFNPDSLKMDYFFRQKLQPLYEKGFITKEQLLTRDDKWLWSILSKYYPEEIKWYLDPGQINWKEFSTSEEQKKFADKIEERVINSTHSSGFKLGFDLPIIDKSKNIVMPIRKVIGEEKINKLEEISKSTEGYYLYYK